MKVPLTIVIAWLCLCDGSAQNTLAVPSTLQDYMDPQIVGFNNSNMTSGPIVVADKRTLFVTDFHYFGPSGDLLQFWVGANASPYNDSEKQLIFENHFSGSSSANFYLELPENLTTDSIRYLLVSGNGHLNYVLFESLNRASVKEYDALHKEDSVYRVPKCCPGGLSYEEGSSSCVTSPTFVPLTVQIFESNETGLDPELTLNTTSFLMVPYHRNLQCGENEIIFEITELNGLIYNSSLIVQGLGILGHGEFCVEVLHYGNSSSSTISLACLVQEPSEPNFYLPTLILSTICFALSAAAYAIILKEHDVHKWCFIMFSSWMCLAFICLIFMQVQNGTKTCNTFGFAFIFTVVLSFLWLLILCLELLYQVTHPVVDKRYKPRFYWYCGISSAFALLILAITLISGQRWIPDVPNSFIMPYGDTSSMCRFETPFARAFITFVPIIVSILGSFASLIALQSCMNRNESNAKISNHFDWVNQCNSYKFLSRTYIVIIIVACFWILNIFFYSDQLANTKTQLALDVIKASLGFVTFVGFVGNKYTRKEILMKFKKSKVTETDMSLNDLPTPVTPEENQPLYPPQDHNMSTFQSNGRTFHR